MMMISVTFYYVHRRTDFFLKEPWSRQENPAWDFRAFMKIWEFFFYTNVEYNGVKHLVTFRFRTSPSA